MEPNAFSYVLWSKMNVFLLIITTHRRWKAQRFLGLVHKKDCRQKIIFSVQLTMRTV